MYRNHKLNLRCDDIENSTDCPFPIDSFECVTCVPLT